MFLIHINDKVDISQSGRPGIEGSEKEKTIFRAFHVVKLKNICVREEETSHKKKLTKIILHILRNIMQLIVQCSGTVGLPDT